MARFTLPRDLYHGKGSLDELKNLKGKKAIVVVGGGSMKRFGFLDKAVNNLKEAGMEVRLFENVEPDPSVETVMKGAAAMREFEPDWIVAMGGGSPIDAAKAMWAFYEYPETSFEDLITPFSFPTLRQKARFCAIPSTSGTATEVTAFSVITDYQKGIKYPLADFNITPDVAIVDPDLAETMPKKLTAHTGMDAMTHAIEAYVSTLHCDYTDPLALHAIPRHSGGPSFGNVGTLRAGSGRHVVPDHALMQVEVRGETTEINRFMMARTEEICRGAAAMQGCACSLTVMGTAEGQHSDLALIGRIGAVIRRDLPGLTLSTEQNAKNWGSDDVSVMMNRVQAHGGQATYMRAMADMAGAQHTVTFDFDEAVLGKSVAVFCAAAMALMEEDA